MTVDCDVQKNVLTILWLVVGMIIGLLVGYFVGKRKSSSGEYIYRGPGGEE